MDDAPGRSRGRVALRLALALPLACVLLVGALWVGQELRAYRAPASSPAPTDDGAAQTGAAQAGAAQAIGQPIQVIQLPPGLTDQVSIAIASPDGAYFVTRTADFTRLALVRVLPAPDDAYLKTDLVATLPDVNFVAWLPDATGFIAQGTKVANTPATPPPFGTKLESKLFDVYRVDLAGATTKLGVAAGGIFALSPDAKLIAAFDGDARLIAIHTDGTGIDPIANDPAAGSAPSLLGWDASGAILRADWRAPFTIRRVPLAGPPSVLPSGGVTSALLARSSPDRRGALLTASFPGQCECDALLTDRLTAMPDGTYPAWVGPHSLLTRAADEHAGMLDVLTSARTTLSAKMRSEQIRIIAVSMPYVLWLDVTKAVPHLLDVRADRDTGLGLSPPPANAQPLSGGRFFAWREKSLLVLDAGAFFRTIPATASPIPLAKDQSGVPAGFIRVARPEGGWSVVIPSAWYRRDAPLRGSEFTSYDPEGMDYSGNAPPAGGARVVIEAANDYGASDLHEYARRAPIVAMPGNVVRSAADVSVAGQPAYTVTTSVNQPPPFDGDLRFWFVRSPYFPDRVFVIQAAVARAQEVDAVVASLRFFAPAPDPAPTLTRAQVVAKYSQPTFSATRVDRVEAKLVRWKDYEKAAGGFRSGTNDPDEP